MQSRGQLTGLTWTTFPILILTKWWSLAALASKENAPEAVTNEVNCSTLLTSLLQGPCNAIPVPRSRPPKQGRWEVGTELNLLRPTSVKWPNVTLVLPWSFKLTLLIQQGCNLGGRRSR